MDWQELREMKSLDPKTPAEYAEALMRMLVILINEWDRFEADYACDCIKDFKKFKV